MKQKQAQEIVQWPMGAQSPGRGEEGAQLLEKGPGLGNFPGKGSPRWAHFECAPAACTAATLPRLHQVPLPHLPAYPQSSSVPQNCATSALRDAGGTGFGEGFAATSHFSDDEAMELGTMLQ